MRSLLPFALVLLSALTTHADHFDDVIESCKDSIVRVIVQRPNDISVGSGTYLGDGIVLTCRHLFHGAQGDVDLNCKTTVIFAGTQITGRVIATSKTDQSLIQLYKPVNITGIPLATNEVDENEIAYAAGFGHSLNSDRLRFWHCRISGIYGDPEAGNRKVIIGLTGPGRGSRDGDSGGPVLNSRGQVISNLWGNVGGETHAITNDETLRFVRETAGRFPVLRGVLSRAGSCVGLSCGPSVCYQGQCSGPRYDAGVPAYPIQQGTVPSIEYRQANPTITNPLPPASNPFSLQRTERPISPPVVQRSNVQPSSGGQGLSLQPPANAPPPIELQYVAPREDQLREVIAQMQQENPDAFRGKPGKNGRDGVDGKDGSPGRQGERGPAGLSASVDTSSFATVDQMESRHEQVVNRLERILNVTNDRYDSLALSIQSKIEQSPATPLLTESAWSKYLPGLVSALGYSSPMALAIMAGAYFLRRRSGGSDDRPFPIIERVNQAIPMIQQPTIQPVYQAPAIQQPAQPLTITYQPPIQQTPRTPQTVPRTRTETTRTVEETKQELHPMEKTIAA